MKNTIIRFISMVILITLFGCANKENVFPDQVNFAGFVFHDFFEDCGTHYDFEEVKKEVWISIYLFSQKRVINHKLSKMGLKKTKRSIAVYCNYLHRIEVKEDSFEKGFYSVVFSKKNEVMRDGKIITTFVTKQKLENVPREELLASIENMLNSI